MKILFVVALLMFSSSTNADDESKDTENQSIKKGETIWIEEKISPTTNWIENLAKPLTNWMERQINGPKQDDSSPNIQKNSDQRKVDENATNSTQASPEDILEDTLDHDLLIGHKEIETLAKGHIAGDVLYIKLLTQKKQYRVKLISKLGEIHIIYIQATSGEIVEPHKKELKETVDQDDEKQNSDDSLGL